MLDMPPSDSWCEREVAVIASALQFVSRAEERWLTYPSRLVVNVAGGSWPMVTGPWFSSRRSREKGRLSWMPIA
jgi:hypothetical protein